MCVVNSNGRLYFTILAALGEAERERIQERTLAVCNIRSANRLLALTEIPQGCSSKFPRVAHRNSPPCAVVMLAGWGLLDGVEQFG